MKFLKKLYQSILDSMYYVELHLILFFSTICTIYVFNLYRQYDNNLFAGIIYVSVFLCLYLLDLIIYIFHIYNKFRFKKKIPEIHKFSGISKFMYLLIIIINIACHFFFWAFIVF